MQQEQHAYAYQLQENTIVIHRVIAVHISMLPPTLNAVLLLNFQEGESQWIHPV